MTVIILQILPRLLDEVYLGTGHGWSGDKAAVFGADQAQIALCRVGAILRGLEFSLESADPGDALLRHAFLLLQLSLVDAYFLGCFVKWFLQQSDVLRILFNLNHYLLNVTLLLTKYLYSLSVSAFFFIQLEFQITNLCKNYKNKIY